MIYRDFLNFKTLKLFAKSQSVSAQKHFNKPPAKHHQHDLITASKRLITSTSVLYEQQRSQNEKLFSTFFLVHFSNRSLVASPPPITKNACIFLLLQSRIPIATMNESWLCNFSCWLLFKVKTCWTIFTFKVLCNFAIKSPTAFYATSMLTAN